MPVYELLDGKLSAANPTHFHAEGLRERQDIQRMLREQISVLGDDLFVLAEEYGGWVDSNRRIDLLCIDSDANLVVVELKRDDSAHMELQALRYAAMVARMTFSEAVVAHAEFRRRCGLDGDEAEAAILAFLRWDEAVEDDFAKAVRVVLASAEFGKELTTAVLWLRDQGIDIVCIRLSPSKLSDGRMLLDVQQIIPLPEAAEFQTQIGFKRQAEIKGRVERHELRYLFWQSLLKRAAEKTTLHAHIMPRESTWLSVRLGRDGMQLGYSLRAFDNNVSLWMTNKKHYFDALFVKKDEIEREFGESLGWSENVGKNGAAIYYEMPGGYKSSADQFDGIQNEMVDRMIRLDQVLRSRIMALPQS